MAPSSNNSITAESRELLGRLRDLLLEQHKLLLDRERAAYEKIHGPIAGPGPFLALVLGDSHFAWLKQISTLVVEIDEALARRSKADQMVADSLAAQARELMKLREHGDEFQVRYYNAVQESPDVVILQCRIEHLLETLPDRGVPSGMNQIDVDQIAEVNYPDDPAGTVEVKFKDGTTKRFNGEEHPEIFAILNHWTPPTA